MVHWAYILLASTLWAATDPPSPSGYAPGGKQIEKLSWTPMEHLMKGYRTAPWLNDLFYPSKNTMHLSGLISGEMAFINGEWYRLGQTIQGYKIMTITGSQVELDKKGEKVTLKMTE